ncbi:MAG: valine--tRNA ligase [Clostridia bacterium]|nr:valine--tRNA ligase [Clostridia bacterium]
MENKIEMAKTYEPQSVESRIYESWEKSGAFAGKVDRSKKPFCIVMPPPNVTGQLHMGHALDNTLQDILTRYHRMKGDATLWLPGTDHASIATEVKIVEAMAKEGLTKNDLGRDAFLERAWDWKRQYGGRIVQQLRYMGSSCDWSRERFTMDEGCSRAVLEVFVKLYNEGLIYKGQRIVNWCPHDKTAISDAEVEYEEQASHLWHIRYPAEDGGEGVVVATTRPETMLGDTGVAVNPEDERYKHLVGKNVMLPLRNRPIPVVADEYVELEFGTGAVKMTPAHDPNDFEVAKRHDLVIERVMNDDGTMTDACGKYAGMTAMDCRKAVVADLEALGLLVKIEDYSHNVGTCQRCGHTIEPLASEQWFVRMEPLAKPAIEAVRNGSIRFVPERFDKNYFHWMENTRDWCISRQLWWGHRIPVYYCDDCGEVMCMADAPHKCTKCGSTNIRQDEDVLDTWFSSALWPFSTLGWPDKTEELDFFYPTTCLVTGYDIITFWVSRMIFSGLAYMNEKPFSDVIVHGLVRDSQGRKMSKSLGNGVDPIEVIEKYGADALRFSLVFGVAPGNDMRYSDEKVEAARNFANKLWNASRYSIMNLEGEESPEKLSLADKWILTRLAQVTKEITEHLDSYDTGIAAQQLYDFVWTEFCDWYLELSKSAMYGEDKALAAGARYTLRKAITSILKLLHPFMPFLTEEIYSFLGNDGFIMLSDWPKAEDFEGDAQAASDMEGIMDIIKAVRVVRVERNVPASKKARIMLLPAADFDRESIERGAIYFERLASASTVSVIDSRSDAPKNAVSAVCVAGEAFLPLEELVDISKEIERLKKEILNIENEIKRAEGKLNNQGFVAKAPAAVVEAERVKLNKNTALKESMLQKLKDFE